MAHIVVNGGEFVSVLPATRKEDGAFRRYLVDHEPSWSEALRRTYKMGEPDDVYETTEAPWPSAEGYRTVWVRSSAKVTRDAGTRQSKIAAGIAAVDELNQRLGSHKTRMKDDRIRPLGHLYDRRDHRGPPPPGDPRMPRHHRPLPQDREHTTPPALQRP